MDSDYTDWHRLFGLILTDFFTNSPFKVEFEQDLSVKKQMLDVVILRKEEGVFEGRLPDGLDPLLRFNLITFKSYQEALTPWALKELISHYVNFRKQTSPSMQNLLPEEEFRLFAVSARYPQSLAGQVPLTKVQQGVFDCRWGTDIIRVLVLRQLPQCEHNALMYLFSASREQVLYGAEHCKLRSNETSTLLDRLFRQYQQEGLKMPYSMEEFRRDYLRDNVTILTPEERVAGLSPKERVAGLSPKERVAGLSPEELLAVLSPEEQEALRRHLQRNDSSAPSE